MTGRAWRVRTAPVAKVFALCLEGARLLMHTSYAFQCSMQRPVKVQQHYAGSSCKALRYGGKCAAGSVSKALSLRWGDVLQAVSAEQGA